jgi:hypothetical protein
MTACAEIVLGAGKLYFAEDDATGAMTTGFRYLGDSPTFSLNAETEKLEVYDSDSAVAELCLSITKQINRTGSTTLRSVTMENLAMFLMGDVSTISQTGTSVTDEAITGVTQGLYYQIGGLHGAQQISALAVTGTGGTPTYTLTDDYTVDESGLLYIVPGGAIADATDLELDYTTASVDYERLITNADGAKTGALKYVTNNTAGSEKTYLFPKVELAANGEAALKSRDDPMELPITISVNKRTGYESIYVNGRPAAA